MVNFCQILITIGVMFCLQNKEDIKNANKMLALFIMSLVVE